MSKLKKGLIERNNNLIKEMKIKEKRRIQIGLRIDTNIIKLYKKKSKKLGIEYTELMRIVLGKNINNY